MSKCKQIREKRQIIYPTTLGVSRSPYDKVRVEHAHFLIDVVCGIEAYDTRERSPDREGPRLQSCHCIQEVPPVSERGGLERCTGFLTKWWRNLAVYPTGQLQCGEVLHGVEEGCSGSDQLPLGQQSLGLGKITHGCLPSV